MKFLCDRCKTRYSIGEDRVRGKILKIRCKNCSNVITVREGMAEPSADADARRSKPTTLAPVASPAAPPPASGKAGAPAALTEEWYVSIDGDQQGPFSLADAQRWIESKPLDADLHCWSEGFDDWLPVDKVSHFRGLRQRASQPPAPPPRASAPPPVPRGAGGMTASSGADGRRDESEPKPLFAATMAAIEKTSGPIAAPAMPPVLAGSGPAPQTTKSAAVPAPSTVSNGSGSVPALGRASNLSGTGPQRMGTAPGMGAPPFDSATEIEQPPFNDEASTTAEPVAAAKRNGAHAVTNGTGPTGKVSDRSAPPVGAVDPFAAKPAPAAKADPFAPRPADPFAAKPAHDPFASGHDGPTMASPPPAMPNPTSVTDSDDDDGLNIGEVSRVVNLADLMRQGRPNKESQPVRRAATAPAVLQVRTGSMPHMGSGSVPKLAGTGPAAAIPGTPSASFGDPSASVEPGAEPLAPIAPVVQHSHRRGMIALLVGAAALLGAAIVVVVLVTSKSEVNYGDRLSGGGTDIDTTRPDDPIRKIQQQLGSGSAVEVPDITEPGKTGGRKPNTGGGTSGGGNPGGNNLVPNPVLPSNSLKAEEIEAMAAKNAGVTQRCWIRAQRGETGLLIADIKKINVTLAVDPTGKVNDVTLSQASDNALGKCLISAVKTWSFRPNSGGTFKFSMVFTGS